uniref:F-box domain-containing protein n=1 Tax=Ditylenchus dipsaci TaxID=166011 RepID=A0A915E9G7_9BILA
MVLNSLPTETLYEIVEFIDPGLSRDILFLSRKMSPLLVSRVNKYCEQAIANLQGQVLNLQGQVMNLQGQVLNLQGQAAQNAAVIGILRNQLLANGFIPNA